MSRARLGTVATLLFALLAFPREGRANILDLIWEMSGPEMIGAVFLHCRVDISSGSHECRSFDRRFSGGLDGLDAHRAWVSLEGAYYFSTTKNQGRDEYRPWRIQMVALEPILEVRSGRAGDFMFYHGLVGLTYNILYGENVQEFDTFDKIGFKFRPVGATFWKLDLAANVRVYPNGFGRDEFGFEPRLGDVDRPAEVTYGFSVGLKW